MKYRNYKGKDVSLLGFGTMRLPLKSEVLSDIDEQQTIDMIRKAIDSGVNYVDTAYMYHDGHSEVVTGKALKDGYREKVFLADKLPVWYAKTPTDLQKIFDLQLERLDDDHIDFYLVHNINEAIWKQVKELNAIEFCQKLKQEGKIKNLGFSFHGSSPEFFKEVLDAFPWDFCQIQFNYVDTNLQAGLKGLEYATEKKIPVIIMEPLKGGKLVDKVPESIKKVWSESDTNKSPQEWAFSYVANFEGVLTVLSGINNIEQLDDNLNIFDNLLPSSLSGEELKLIERVKDEYNRLTKYDCTNCKYCMPCEVKIDIPFCLGYLNEYYSFDKNEKVVFDYKTFCNPKRPASSCIACRKCMEKCPQGLDIVKALKEAASIFE